MVFRRVRSDLRAPLYFGGNARTALSGIRLVDVELAVAAAPSPTRSFLAECAEVAPRGVASENLTVRWNGFRGAWAGVSDRGGGADCGSLWVATVHTAVETWRRSGVAPALRRRAEHGVDRLDAHEHLRDRPLLVPREASPLVRVEQRAVEAAVEEVVRERPEALVHRHLRSQGQPEGSDHAAPTYRRDPFPAEQNDSQTTLEL